jgi:hypothetical protein
MNRTEPSSDWETDVRRQFSLEPTVGAMHRHLLFTMRSESVRAGAAALGQFQTIVDWDGTRWEGTGASEAESLGRVLLAMSGDATSPLPNGFEDRGMRE